MRTIDDPPKLRSIYLYITNGCNLRCRHCWIEAGPNEQGMRPDLDFEAWKRIINEAIELGLKSVKLTGGEPLLIRDVTYPLMLYLRDKNIRVIMETNGTLLDNEISAFFAETDRSFISVSLDGPTAEMHDSFRCLPGSFDLTIKGMELLAQYGVAYQLICAIHKENNDCAEEMVRLGIKKKACSVRFLPVNEMGRGTEMTLKGKTFNVEETIQFYKHVEKLNKNYPISVISNQIPAFHSLPYIKEKKFFNSCGLPNMCGMLADGTLALCGIGAHNSDTVYGNALETPLRELWTYSSRLLEHRQLLKEKTKGICSICVFRKLCNGLCRATPIERYGDINGPNPFCQDAFEEGLFPEQRIIGEQEKAKEWRSISLLS